MLVRRPEQFPSAAARMYAVFDLGAVFYWAIPTAPPWWAAAHGRSRTSDPVHMRRMMIEYGEQFWGDRWGPFTMFSEEIRLLRCRRFISPRR